MVRTLALIALLSSAALAQPAGAPMRTEQEPLAVAAPTKLAGDKAKALIRGFKLAGVKAKAVKRTWTWSAKTVSCKYVPDPDGGYVDDGDGLGSAECQVDGKKFTLAAAHVLVQAMHDAGVPEPYRMGDKLVRANDVTCTNEQTKRGADGPWSCTFTPVGR